MKLCKSNLSLGPVLIGILLASLASAQQPQTTDDLKKDIEALKEGQKAIQKDLQEIKTLLQRPAGPPPPPQNVVLELGKSPFKGESKAKLTLVEFSDYQ